MALRVSFQEELDRTEAALQEEGELVLRALRGALNALWEQDAELSDEVIAFDDQIDGIYFRIRRASRRFSPGRLPSRATCGSCSRSSTRTSISSGWATTA